MTLAVTLAAIGCATPGIPRPPSLNLPEPAHDLTAARIGDTVELRFTLPSRSTDKLPLRGANLTAIFCRALDPAPCTPIPSSKSSITLDPATTSTNTPTVFTWTDTLPAGLTRGDPRLLTYSVELFNAAGRSAGNSTPAFTAAGTSPPPLEALRAEGSRLGIVLRWNATPQLPSDVILQREDLALTPAKPSKPNTTPTNLVQLTTPPAPMPPASSLLDATAQPNIPYRYTATRRLTIHLGSRSIELRSAPSPAVALTLQTIYPPLAPTGLTAAAYFADAPSPNTFAVDLIWQPVDDAGLIAPLAGYNLYRAPTGTTTQTTRLNPTPLALPSFHDTTANPTTHYRYSVTAIDIKGNESPAATILLDPSTAPQP
jgi:hypothetical protein